MKVVLDISVHTYIPKRQRTGAVQNAAAASRAPDQAKRLELRLGLRREAIGHVVVRLKQLEHQYGCLVSGPGGCG